MRSRTRTRFWPLTISRTFRRARSRQRLAEYGVTLAGQLSRFADLRAAKSQYTDVDGSSKYFVPPDKVLVAAAGLQGTLAYAGIVQVDEEESR